MSELVPWGKSEIAKARRDISVASLKLDGLAEFNDRVAEHIVDLDRRRQLRVLNDPGIAPMLADLMIHFFLDAVALQHRMFRRY
jgi:hypothetical protein